MKNSIVLIFCFMFLSTNLKAVDWNFENPNGNPFLLSITKGTGQNFGISLPVSKWATIKYNINENDHYELILNEDISLNKTSKVSDAIQLEFHIPLYKLFMSNNNPRWRKGRKPNRR